MEEEKQALQLRVLKRLDELKIIEDSTSIESAFGVGADELTSALLSLQSHDLITLTPKREDTYQLTPEAEGYLKEGSPEFQVWKMCNVPVSMEAMKGKAISKLGVGAAMKRKWIKIDKAAKQYVRLVEAVEDETAQLLGQCRDDVSGVQDKVVKDLKKRKLLSLVKKSYFEIAKGTAFRVDGIQKLKLDFTSEMLADPSNWQDPSQFKPLNLEALGKPPSSGCLHPVMKVRQAFREILIEMGFSEMPTNRWVESSFWNFDALFQPQQHPARDAHDTFFLSAPAQMQSYPADYMEVVKETHEKGFPASEAHHHLSLGWRYKWSAEEAKRNILRTHTTACSARMLYLLGKGDDFKPVRYFSIDRVYRNETLDAKHLAEFFQIEGVVADYGLTLADLMGTIRHFFAKWGLTQIRFKPAYNPYTEPSMEIFAYHPGMCQWLEIGNSGIFRPEMLEPMGLPSGVRVIAWGLGLERPTMIRYRLKHIRELWGHKLSLDVIQANPVCDIQLDAETESATPLEQA